MTDRPVFGRRGLPQRAISVPNFSPARQRAATPDTFVPRATDVFSPGTVDGTSERSLFTLFFGPKADLYLATLEKLREKNAALTAPVRGWCWPAFFVPLPWLLYRKMWGAAAAIVLLPILIYYFVPAVGGLGGFGSSIVIAMLAKSFYVQSAAGKIRRITSENADPAVVRDKVGRAGGVSVAGAVIGGTILFIVFGIIFTAAFVATVEARRRGLR